MSDAPVNGDLQSLMNLQLPPQEDKLGRNVVKFTILCLVVAFISSLAVVTYALFASLARESDLKSEIGCVRQSGVNVDKEVADGISVLIDNGNVILVSLDAVATGDNEQLATSLSTVDDLVQSGKDAKIQLDEAIARRQEAVDSC